MRILIVLPGALGDVIRALPLLARLRRGRPEAFIAWAVEPLSAPLLQGHPWLDEVVVFPRREGWGAVWPYVRRLRAGRFDVAIDLGRGIKSAAFARATGAPVRLGFDRRDARELSWWFSTATVPPQGDARSKLEQFVAFGDLLELPAAPIEFGLVPTTEEAAHAAGLLADLPRPLVAACVGSSCPSRRWEPDRTAAVIRAVTATGGGAVVLGAAADRAFGAAVSAGAGGNVRDLTGRTTLRELQAVLAECRLAFGPDSGALHLAAALGRRVVSLWGPTSAWRSTPWGSDPWVVQADAPCAPCFLKHCPIDRVCMKSLETATVARAAAAAWAA